MMVDQGRTHTEEDQGEVGNVKMFNKNKKNIKQKEQTNKLATILILSFCLSNGGQ